MENNLISLSTLDDYPVDTIGQDILRYIALPDVLGPEKDTLLYFMGRNIARKFNFDKMEDVNYFFFKLKWGKLELIKENKKQLTFHLMADDIVERMNAPLEVDFRLESGFIAETMFHITGRPCECTESINQRLYRIEFKVHYLD